MSGFSDGKIRIYPKSIDNYPVPQPVSRARSHPLALCPLQPNPAPAGAKRRAGIVSPGQSECAQPLLSQHLEDMKKWTEDKSKARLRLKSRLLAA